ncbi:hypothetical protein [Corynebacterium lipophiloflavum]|uniref:N-acetyltransferase domain-containing protein n=1 Tax=Corynebacterium lipophiloflavum (strain ATCC 700352 / DSM 44291 / CCUG 37336 / JCM 10383 / DMMZ 1944) TaxID=525263 RepID=C0XTH2_CORLD|nr:hypothetical protein [Corynebacterium lipophiloflavum]EEI16469.1 hypothetical protein HMPREF0298_1742 [Corynebacterium lipophiloflavum DSM 44291]
MALTYNSLERIHRHTAASTFWELDPLHSAYAGARSEADKGAWLVQRALRQSTVGFSIAEASSTVGALATVLFCPAADAPGVVRMPTAPPSRDAWLVTSLHIEPASRGRGWESVLLDAVIMAATERGAAALEVFGLRPGATASSELCRGIIRQRALIGIVEVPVLESAGFKVVRDHPVIPRLRVDLPPAHELLSATEVAELLADAPVRG